jgi:hypothetical protein
LRQKSNFLALSEQRKIVNLIIRRRTSLLDVAPPFRQLGGRGRPFALAAVHIMPQGKKWSSEECEALAKAWINVSEDSGSSTVKGTDQTSDRFWFRVVATLKCLAPAAPEDCIGKYHNRELKALRSHWTDKLSRDVRKFNKAIAKVYAAQLTGVDENQKINIAISIVKGKIDAPSARMKDVNPGDWMYYRAWLVLKEHVSFMPPKERDAIELEEEEETEEEETVPNVLAVPDNPSDAPANGVAIPSDLSVVSGSVHRGRGRGPGPGRKKTKLDALQAKYMERKMKNMDTMVEIAKGKAKELKKFVKNNTYTNACKMAYMGYHGTKNAQLKRKYEKMMHKIVNAQQEDDSDDGEEAVADESGPSEGLDGDDDEDLPPLIGV